jgi:hypothetical protein
MRTPLLFALLLSSAASAPTQPAPSATPSTVDVAAARAFFDVLGAGSRERLDDFIDTRISPRAAEYEPPAQLGARIRGLAEQSGGIDIAEWTEVGDQVRFTGRSRRGGISVRGIVGMDGGKLVGFQISPDRRARGADAPPGRPPQPAKQRRLPRSSASSRGWLGPTASRAQC